MKCPYAYIWRNFDGNTCVFCHRCEYAFDDLFLICHYCDSGELCDIDVVTEYLKYRKMT